MYFPKPRKATQRVTYPDDALVRVKDICGDRKAGRPGLLPIDASTWYDWVKAGRVPAGRKIGENTVVWPLRLILALGKPPEDATR